MTDADSVRSLDQVTAEWLTGRMRAAGHTDADSVRSLDQVTAEWLTGRMRAAGHTDAEVIGFRHQPVGTGQARSPRRSSAWSWLCAAGMRS